MQPSGLLFYNGRLNEKHDFLALELVSGQVRLTYSTGGCHEDMCGQVGACVGEMGAVASPKSLGVCLPAKQTSVRTWCQGKAHLSKRCRLLLSVRGTLVQPAWSSVVGSDLMHPGSPWK